MDKTGRIGRYLKNSVVGGEFYESYLPKPLPPEPPVDLHSLYSLVDRANVALGRLDGLSTLLPDTNLFLYMYIRKEAVLSSQIEGTQSSLSDLLLHEASIAPGVPFDDVAEVSCYVNAITYALARLRDLPLSLRLIREIHERLMHNNRGVNKKPGEFRTSQNWVGGSRPGNAVYVPPPPDHLMDCLDAFEKFLHSPIQLPLLVKAALAHVQFETIHPFLDGNGRLGRLLITLMLCADGILNQPLLYLSLYFKEHRQTYYQHLQSVRTKGDWESWIEFFLHGIVETATQAISSAQAALELFAVDRRTLSDSGRSSATTIAIHDYLKKHPLTNTTLIKETCGVSLPTVIRNLSFLESLGIVKEITGKDRHKIFIYQKYMAILSEGT